MLSNLNKEEPGEGGEGIQMADQAKIIYDHREEASQIPAKLTLLEIETEANQLSVGDYIISEEIIVERKSGKDLAQSIIDGRLFDQVKRLLETYSKPVLIIEGSVPLNKNASKGALVSVFRKGVSIWNVDDSDETVDVLTRLALAEVKKSKGPIIKGKPKKKNNPEEAAIHLLATIPGISADKADRLLKEFGSINKISRLEVKEIQSLEGIGPKTAQAIRDVLNFNFKSGDDIFK